jgi:hypothetical protein
MTQRDDLAECLRHLEYEMAMMVASPRMLAQHELPDKNTDRPDGYFWANDKAVAYLAAMESACAHARVLDDFSGTELLMCRPKVAGQTIVMPPTTARKTAGVVAGC